MGDMIDVELIREVFKSRDALVDLGALFEGEGLFERQENQDYVAWWVDKFIDLALFKQW